MNNFRKNREKFVSNEFAAPFLRPSWAAIACLIIIFLFIIAGFMNLRAVKKSLIDLTGNNGLTIIKNVQQIAKNYYQQLIIIPHMVFNYENENLLREYNLGISESFLFEIAEITRKIDLEWGSKFFDNDNFHSFLSEQSIWIVALLDESGNVTYKNRELPSEVINFAKPVIESKSDLKVNIFKITEGQRWGILALRRKIEKGIVIVGFDQENFKERCRVFAIKKAVQDIGNGSGAAYFFLLDKKNNIKGIAGDLLKGRLSLLKDSPLPKSASKTERRIITLGNGKVLELTVPFYIQDQYAGIMGIGLRTEGSERIIVKNRNIIILSTGFLIIIAFLSIWFLYINQRHYIIRMQAMERRINQIERLSAMGRLAAGVAHEIRNPLNAISMAVQRLQKDNPHRLTLVIKDEIIRLNQIIEDFLGVSRSRKLIFKMGDLRELVESILLLKREEIGNKKIDLETSWHDSHLLFSMDQEKMKQAFLNIINNAVESIHESGVISIRSQQVNKDISSIEIQDTGCGLDSEEIKHVFEPDYTTKDKGLGLGLTIAYEIILGHGGEIKVKSEKGKGTIFEILLPIK